MLQLHDLNPVVIGNVIIIITPLTITSEIPTEGEHTLCAHVIHAEKNLVLT